MMNETNRPAKNGHRVYFNKYNQRIPKYCTYCGSNNLNDGGMSKYGENALRCLDCGAQIHDCCTQQGLQEFSEWVKEKMK